MMRKEKKRISAVLVAYFLTWLVIPHVLLARKRPTATLAWVWSIIGLPFLGPLAYFMFGADRMQRKRLRKAAKLGILRHRAPKMLREKLEELPESKDELVQTLANINQVPASTAQHIELLIDSTDFYPALKQAINFAEHHVHIEFFIWRDDEIGAEMLECLVEAAKRGVRVRLLLDQIGCFGVSKSFFDPLVEAGGRFSWFYSLPLWRHSRFMNLRNHRKLQIVDGRIGFVGGMNIGREYAGRDPELGSWHDAQMRVEGAVVKHLQELFAEDWFFATNEIFGGDDYFTRQTHHNGQVVQVIAGGPDVPREPIPKSIVALLGAARRRVWLTTGYFVPNQLFLTALQLCAARGVDVRLLVSEKSDHRYLVEIGRSYYEDLMQWGVRVFEFSKGINHKKAMLLDDEWLMIGSANSDNRSMRLNFELNLLAHTPAQAARFEELLLKEFSESQEIILADFVKRPFPRRLLEAALRPLAPML
jgi:cardiolipin synthase